MDYYSLSRGPIDRLTEPPQEGFSSILSLDSSNVPYLLFLTELEGSEESISKDQLLSNIPGFPLRRSGKTFVFRFLYELVTPEMHRYYLASACSPEHIQFRPDSVTLVGMLDVLGFRNVVEKENLEDLVFKMRNGLGSLLAALPVLCECPVDLSPDHLSWDPTAFGCSFAAVLDSVLLWVERPSLTPLYDICLASARLMRTALAWGWVFRGGIDYGEFYGNIEEGVFVGRGLIKAHELELAQDWGGCVLSKRLSREFPEDLLRLRREGLIVEYPVPFKDRSRCACAVNWLQPAMPQPDNVEKTLHELARHAPSAGKVKIANTIAFCSWVKEQGLFGVGELRANVVSKVNECSDAL